MDRFGIAVTGGFVTVDTSLVVQGPPIGTNTTGQEAEGPHCITGGSEAAKH
jgi:cytochrome b6-f complex iron-sulfur subunit